MNPFEGPHLSRRSFMIGAAGAVVYSALGPAYADGPWQPFQKPTTEQGLVLVPRLVTLKGKVTLVWSGTNASVRQPEIIYCNAGDEDEVWGKARAPFFGNDMGRVRRLAVATARDAMAIVFQRESSQGNGAVEVYLTVSYDSGYSFSTPFVMDSYVLGQQGGSYLSCAARQGKSRPEFAALWVAEGGVVRACGIDQRSSFRPQAKVVGEVENIKGKAEIVGAGGDGFYAVWPQEGNVKTARVKPLTTSVEDATTLFKGTVVRNFGVASYYRGPGFITTCTEGGEFKIHQAKDGKLVEVFKNKFPMTQRGLDSRTALEKEEFLHMAVVEGGAKPKLHYITNRSGSWSTPEVIMNLEADVPISGFDITVSDSYVWTIVSQEQLVTVMRRKLG
ncbi:MAG: hypothetical protein KF760_00530 [Candidatus Eremiobacteraeota bacterium]|nr:hypothetical protein [Candidatus Eremiobacteraeota bacterium]MCW5867226.1 hypothetical protein [Candidatus Eremiobacteraeota bacterium]